MAFSPVKPERYRTLGAAETNSAPALRAASASASRWRRATNSLAWWVIGIHENVSTVGQALSFGAPHNKPTPGSNSGSPRGEAPAFDPIITHRRWEWHWRTGHGDMRHRGEYHSQSCEESSSGRAKESSPRRKPSGKDASEHQPRNGA